MPRDAAFWIAALHSDVCGRPSVIETALVREIRDLSLKNLGNPYSCASITGEYYG
jgi:hypothetical protein